MRPPAYAPPAYESEPQSQSELADDSECVQQLVPNSNTYVPSSVTPQNLRAQNISTHIPQPTHNNTSQTHYQSPRYEIDAANSVKARSSSLESDNAANLYESVTGRFIPSNTGVYTSVPVAQTRPDSFDSSTLNREATSVPAVDWASVRTSLEYGRPFDDTCELSAKTLGTGFIPFDKENAEHGSFRTSKFGTIDMCGSLLPLVTGTPIGEHHKAEVMKLRAAHKKINNRHNKWHRKECKDIEKEYVEREKQERKRQRKVLGVKKRQLDRVEDKEFINSLDDQLMAKLCDKTTKVYNTIFAEERGCYLAIHELDRNELQSMDASETAALAKKYKKEKTELKHKNVGNKMKAFVLHNNDSDFHDDIKETHKSKKNAFQRRKDTAFAALKAEQTRRVQLYNQLQIAQMHEVQVFYQDIIQTISETLASIALSQPFITMPLSGSLSHSQSMPAGAITESGGDTSARDLQTHMSQGTSSSQSSPRVAAYSSTRPGRCDSLGPTMSISVTSAGPRFSSISYQSPLHQTSVQEEIRASAPPLDAHAFRATPESTLPGYSVPLPSLTPTQSHVHTHAQPYTEGTSDTKETLPAHRRSSSASSSTSAHRQGHSRSNSGYVSPNHASSHGHDRAHARSHSQSRSPRTYPDAVAEQAATPPLLSPKPRPPPRKPTPTKGQGGVQTSEAAVASDEGFTTVAHSNTHTLVRTNTDSMMSRSSRTPSPTPVPRPRQAQASTLQAQLNAGEKDNGQEHRMGSQKADSTDSNSQQQEHHHH